MNFLPGIASTTSALSAERVRLDAIAQNIANAHTTRGPDGKPYQRREVVFDSILTAAQQSNGNTAVPLLSARVIKDPRPPVLVYDPGHRDADAEGMVAMPDINIHQEMADLIMANRVYEANLAVAKNARTLAMQTLAIGKR
ncbi:MAG: flagellar basal body rod protein FlgC [Verrucomicrobia bacterium]|nr:flagellar basal body rod protein FlgC [Verrucomicrobiota bacterium]